MTLRSEERDRIRHQVDLARRLDVARMIGRSDGSRVKST